MVSLLVAVLLAGGTAGLAQTGGGAVEPGEAYVTALTKFLSGSPAEAATAAKAGHSAQGQYVLGQSLAAAGKAAEAAATLTAVADQWPASPLADDALLAAARLWHQELARPEKAIELCRRLETTWSESPLRLSALLEAALAEEQRENFDAALVTYEQILIEARRLPEGRGDHLAARSAAAERRGLIEAAGKIGRSALAMYVKAERLARTPASRTEALRELIGLAALYADSPLVGDAFAQMMRIHLVKGDEAAARQTFDRLLKMRPARLGVEPLRSCGLHMARWLLEDVDRQIASGAEVFPELFGYKAGTGLRTGSSQGPAVGLAFEHSDGSRSLKLSIRIHRVEGTGGPYGALGLRLEESLETGNDLLAGEIRQAVGIMKDALLALNEAAGRMSEQAAREGGSPRAATLAGTAEGR